MTDQFRQVMQSDAESRAIISGMGGLPEISAAADALHDVIDQTRAEINDATLASRFPTTASDNFLTMLGSQIRSPRATALIEKEGEAGFKRAQLASSLDSIEAGLGSIIQHLVELRCDLKASTTEW